MKKQLIVNADDFGLSHGITDGILQAHLKAIVTSASFMANQAASEYALDQLRFAPELGVGIHLNLCEGPPVSAPNNIATLVTPDGKFFPPDQMARKLWRWQVSPREIETEFRGQIRWMKDRGITPSHADSHHHLHMYPCASFAFRRALEKEGIFRARAPRHRYWPHDGNIGGPHAGPVYRRLCVCTYMRFLQSAVFRQLSMPDYSVVPQPRYRGDLGLLEESWTLLLDHMPHGSYELVCHPGLPQNGCSDDEGFRNRRQLELIVLSKQSLQDTIERNHIELITYLTI